MDQDPYKTLRERLFKVSWPSLYMFKFIVPAENKKIAQVENMFSSEATIAHQESSTGKYISITIREVMLSPEAVIDVYKKAGEIEGLMAL